MTDSSADRDPLDRLAEDFVARFRAGERPSLEEYAAQLPDRAGEVRDLFPALVEMEQLKPVTADQTGGYTPAVAPSDPVQLGDFRILRRVGQGGMGVVYEAIQESLGRHVALKLLPAEALLDPQKLERFRREAQSAAKLHHTNIVPVFGTGEADGRHFYAMQFIGGHPLDAVIDEVKRLKGTSPATPQPERAVSVVAEALVTGTFAAAVADSSPTVTHAVSPPAGSPSSVSDTSVISSPPLSGSGHSYWATVAHLGAQVADGLAYAHVQGIQHRDIKPANLILDLRGTVWITDFGLAKASDADHDLTQMGDIVGTLRYMAPERFEGAGDHRADIYALGLTMYELLTLTPAFTASNRAKLVEQVIAANPPRPRSINLAIPNDLETIVLKAIARDPAMRYQSAGELADDLRRYQEDRPILARRASSAEQAFRWCRRNKAVASLMAAVMLVFALGAGVSWYFAVQAARKEKDARDEAALKEDEKKKVIAEQGKVLAEQERTSQLLYLARMADAGVAYQDNRIGRVLELLAETTPAAGEPDRRGWEWHFLRRATTSSARIVPLPKVEHRPFQPNEIPPESYTFVWLSADARTVILNRGGLAPGLERWDLTDGKRTGSWPGLFGQVSPDGRFLLSGVPVPGKDEERWVVRDLDGGGEVEGPAALPEVKLGNPGQVMNYSWEYLGPGGAYAVANSGDEQNDGRYHLRPLFVWQRATGKSHRLDTKVGSADPKVAGLYGSNWGDPPFLPSDGKTLLQTSTWMKVGAGTVGDSIIYELQIDRWDVSADPPKWLGSARVPGVSSGNTNDNLDSVAAFSRNGEWYAFQKGRQADVYRVADGRLVWSALLPDGPLAYDTWQGRPPLPIVTDSGNRLIVRAMQNSLLVIDRPDSAADPVGRTHRLHADQLKANVGLASADGGTIVLLPSGKEAVAIWDTARRPTVAAANRAPPRSRPLEPATTRFTPDGRRALDAPGRSLRSLIPFPESLTLRDGPTWREIARLDPPTGFAIQHAEFAAGGDRVVVASVRPEPPKRAEEPVHWAIYDAADGRLVESRELKEGPRWDWAIGAAGPWLIERKREYAVEEKTAGVWQRATEPDPDAPAPPPGGPQQRRPKLLTESVVIRDVRNLREIRRPEPGDWPDFFFRQELDGTNPPVRVQTRISRSATPPGAGNDVLHTLGVAAFDRATARPLWSREVMRAVVPGAPGAHRFETRQASAGLVDGSADGRRLALRWDVYRQNLDPDCRVWVGNADGETERVIPIPFTPRAGFQMSYARIAPDGRMIAVADGTTALLLDADTGDIRHRLTGHGGPVRDAVFSTDSTRLFVYSLQFPVGVSRLTVWDTKTGRRLIEFPLAFEQPNAMNNARAKAADLGQLTCGDGKVFVTTTDGVRAFDGSPFPDGK